MNTRRLALGAGLVGLYLLAVGSLAARAQLWNDELYTWYFAQLPTLGDVWDELSTGVEQIPPLYYVVTRASLALFGDGELALRVPSIIGFLLACTCLFVVVARRTNAWYGLVGALVPLASGAATYAWEARPYALVVGFAAAAVLCHQLRADAVRPRLAVIGLAVALAGGDGRPLLRRPRRPPDRARRGGSRRHAPPARLGGRRRVLRSDRSARRLGSSDPGGAALLRGVLDRVRSGLAAGVLRVPPARRRLLGVAHPDLARHRLRNGGAGCGARRSAATAASRADRGCRGRRLSPPTARRRPRRRARHGRVRRALRAGGRHRACAAHPARPPPPGRRTPERGSRGRAWL